MTDRAPGLRYGEGHVSVAARQASTGVTLANGVRNRRWLCGPPGDIVANRKSLEAKYPGLQTS